MSNMQMILATSHVDRHNERITLSALEGIVGQVNNQIIPMLWNHDPRVPPIGRLMHAHLEPLPDGEYAVVGVAELFDENVDVLLISDGRSIPMKIPTSALEIRWDRSYSTSDDQSEIRQLAALVEGTAQEVGKKAVDPLSILVIAGSYLLGKFAEGFLQKIGEESWAAFSASLKRLFQRKRSTGSEFVLQFQFFPSDLPYPLSVQVNITNPTDEDLESFMSTGITVLDAVVPTLVGTRSDLRTVVFEFSRGKTIYHFAVRKDAVPVLPSAGDNLLSSK